jgi:hypothetical protein
MSFSAMHALFAIWPVSTGLAFTPGKSRRPSSGGAPVTAVTPSPQSVNGEAANQVSHMELFI